MFSNTGLEKLDVSNFKTNKVTNMIHMFSGCDSLKELDVSNFNINNVKRMTGMFSGCRNLEKLNLFNFLIIIKKLIQKICSQDVNH